MLKLGWFSTGRGPGSRNLLRTVMEEKKKYGLDIEIAFVFCNWDNTEEPNAKKEQREMFFDLVKSYDIPLITKSWKTFRPDLWDTDEKAWRDEYGKEIRRLTSEYNVDLGILAGYMLWMDDGTCEAYDMLNLHPALPDGPKGTWQEVIWELIRTDAESQGAMLHLCTPEWDRGAPLTYCSFPIRGGDYDILWEQMYEKLKTSDLETVIAEEGVNEPLFKRIREDGAKREQPLIVETIKSFADGRVKIENKQLIVDGKVLDSAFNLSEEVDGSLGE